MEGWNRRHTHLVAAVCAMLASDALAAGAPLVAQSSASSCAAAVRVGDSAGAAVPDASVLVGEVALRTDSTGEARLPLGSSTPVYARIRRLGYAPARLMLFPSCGLPPVATQVTLDPIAARLSTVTVSAARRPVYAGPLAAFYERRARGDGVFFTHADMLQRNAQRLSDVLRTVNGLGELATRPGIGGGRGARRGAVDRCFPLLIIDGMAQSTIGEVNTDAFDPRGLAGVEVYPDASRTPSEFLTLNNGSRCGTVVIWSRRSDTYLPEPRFAHSDPIPDSLIFDAGDVDQLAQLDTARSVTPVYPSVLRRKSIDGEVSVELVVASDGRPDTRNAKVLSATHRAFGDAVLNGLPLFTFEPARRNEQAVAQRVRLTVAFKAAEP